MQEQELEHLRDVLRDLAKSRASAMKARAGLADALSALQRDYARALRSASLSQEAAARATARCAAVRKQLHETQADLAAERRLSAALREAGRDARADAAALRALLKERERELASARAALVATSYHCGMAGGGGGGRDWPGAGMSGGVYTYVGKGGYSHSYSGEVALLPVSLPLLSSSPGQSGLL